MEKVSWVPRDLSCILLLPVWCPGTSNSKIHENSSLHMCSDNSESCLSGMKNPPPQLCMPKGGGAAPSHSIPLHPGHWLNYSSWTAFGVPFQLLVQAGALETENFTGLAPVNPGIFPTLVARRLLQLPASEAVSQPPACAAVKPCSRLMCSVW